MDWITLHIKCKLLQLILMSVFPDCLLPIALPNKICCCGAEDVSVNAGHAIIFININGAYLCLTYNIKCVKQVQRLCIVECMVVMNISV